MLRKPHKPYKSLEDAKSKFPINNFIGKYHDPNYFSCYDCRGTGKVISPDEVPDVVEGYKHALRIPCSVCNGKGEINLIVFKEFYKEKLNKYKIELKKYNEKKNRVKEILSKLSEEDIVILSEYFSPW